MGWVPPAAPRSDDARVGTPLELTPDAEERIDLLGHEFLADFLARAVRRHPGDFELLAELAGTLTRLGRFQEGLEADRRLVEMAPANPTVHYNLACSLALVGEAPAALEALEHAVELGYDDADHLLRDEDLSSLHASERFRTLVARLQRTSPGDPEG